MDGAAHEIPERWDLIIAHPPCTYLTASSAVRLFDHDGRIKDPEREEKGRAARDFFMQILAADCPRVAIENPAPLSWFRLPAYTQIIEPYYFGDPYRKRTCLWLRGLPHLQATRYVEPRVLWVGSTSGRRKGRVFSQYSLPSFRDQKTRSKTFPGIARAMAEQWGGDAATGEKILPEGGQYSLF